MNDADPAKAAERLRLALDLYELGEVMMRQQLRRRHPAASAAEIEQLLVDWLHTRPGAEYGDAAGTLVPPSSGVKS
ncbi:MAG: hypothetical protein U1E76_26630 [Planctomycetota bacterium]